MEGIKMQQLQTEQKYVAELAQQLGYNIKLIYHQQSTDSCKEKLFLLEQRFPEESWSIDRVIKTIFADVDDELVGFVLPETGQKVTEELVKTAYQQAGIEGDYFKPSVSQWYIPPGMEPGTCTPFVPEDSMKFVDRIFIQEEPGLDSLDVDISVGGTGEEAHQVSLHLPYGAIYDILKNKFDDKIHKMN